MTTPAELQAKIEKLEVNMDRFDNITNGDDSTTVTVDAGVVVPSVAKLMKDILDQFGSDNTIALAQQAVLDAQNWANRPEDSQYTDANGTVGYSSLHYAAKAQAVLAALPVNNYNASVDPTVSNDDSEGYASGSMWLNTVSGEFFACADPATGAAVWVNTSLTIGELGALATQNEVTIPYMADAAKPYDIGFTAGFDPDGEPSDLVVQTYGYIFIDRAIILEDMGGYVLTAPSGAALTWDIELDGTSIFSTLPQVNAGANADAGTAVLSTTSIPANSRLTFKVLQVGSTARGAGLMTTLKGRLA